ncbi:MAG: hypothetical protein K6D91_06105 [Prevotella sp.]|nr:hypothetical protein [Prevotella sp.]
MEKYCEEVRNQIAKGIDFEKDAFELPLSVKSELAEVAKKYGYRKPKDSYFGLGGSFYCCLQRVYKRMIQKVIIE